MNANHLAGSQFESVTEQTCKQVQLLLTWGGQPVHPIPYFQELKDGRVLGALGVRVVQLKNQVTDCFRVKVHAIAKNLDAVDFHVAQTLSRVGYFDGLVVNTVVSPSVSLYPATKVDVDGFKESLPLVAQCQRPVITFKRQIQFGGLPVWKAVLIYRDVPTLRVASSKRVDVKSESGLQGAVFCKADLKGYSQQHVDHVGLVFVALQRKQHPLSPRRVKPAVETHVVADENGMNLKDKHRHT